MRNVLVRSSVIACVVLGFAGASFGQGGTTSVLAGVVVDASGGVIPGADVVAKQNATGVTVSAITNADGVFSFPALNTGIYTVTVSLQGFKTYISNDVVLTSGTGANLRIPLEVGVIEEQVTVSSSSEIVQTQSSTITTTINTNQIQNFAPVNGPDCIEVDPGSRYGECGGVQSLVVTGPMFRQTDITLMKRTKISSRSNFQFGVNILNAFNQPNFVPLTQPTGCNCTAGGIGGTNVLSNFELTSLAGTNTSRLIEVVTRFNW